MALDIETKVENNGTTDAGKLTADEFNELVDAVNENTENITSVTTTADANATDIFQIANGTVMPFDGFVSGKSYTSSTTGSNYDSIWYDTKKQLFLALYGSTYYSQWDIEDKTSYEWYNDDDHLIEDKAYLYNGQIYVWDDEEETLVVAKPEVINNLTSSDTDVALSAYQGKVLNEAIEELEDLVDANTSDIGTLEETINAIESVSDDDIESLFE